LRTRAARIVVRESRSSWSSMLRSDLRTGLVRRLPARGGSCRAPPALRAFPHPLSAGRPPRLNDFMTASTRNRGNPSRCVGNCRSESDRVTAFGRARVTLGGDPRALAGSPPPGSGERQPP
jgi:hypothetical protein